METEIIAEPTNTELLVQCITDTSDVFRSNYGWTFEWFPLGKKEWMYSHNWPRKPDGLAEIKLRTGLELIKEWPKPPARGDHELLTAWARNKIAAIPKLSRAEFLARSHKIISTGGMGAQVVKAKLSVKFDPLRSQGGKFGYRPDLVGHYIDVDLKWWGDGSLTIEAEDVGRDGQIYDLYAWEGCEHEFEHKLLGNCYHGYTCKHCGHKYSIDSGD